MSLEMFGPFAVAFERRDLGVPPYLVLLNLMDNHEVAVVTGWIQEALALGDPQPFVHALLSEGNWRPHLVAAVAFLLDGGVRLDPVLLWRRLATWSWVAPQLAATAMFVDPHFARRSVELVEGNEDLPGKVIASLLGLSGWVPALERKSGEWRSNERIRTALGGDSDQSEKISSRWAMAVQVHFARMGRVLEVRGETNVS